MRDLTLAHVAAAVYGTPWAIMPEKLDAILLVLDRRTAGGLSVDVDWEKLHVERERSFIASLPSAQIRDVAGMRVRQVGRVAVLPMFGTISQRPSLFSRFSGGTSAEQFAAAHDELVADPAVSGIVWDVDSPGGSVAGVPEASDRLFAARNAGKRTIAVSNTTMASAAYWMASAADEVVAAPSSLAGSIGVYTAHEDWSGANERRGVRVSYVYEGKKKVDGNPDAPLTDDARASMQQMVSDYYGQFVAAVARHRRTTDAEVRGGYGEGDVLTARRAVSAGLADRIDTLDAVVRKLAAQVDTGRAVARAGAVSRQAAAKSH